MAGNTPYLLVMSFLANPLIDRLCWDVGISIFLISVQRTSLTILGSLLHS
jgi:hypothetical protein